MELRVSLFGRADLHAAGSTSTGNMNGQSGRGEGVGLLGNATYSTEQYREAINPWKAGIGDDEDRGR